MSRDSVLPTIFIHKIIIKLLIMQTINPAKRTANDNEQFLVDHK